MLRALAILLTCLSLLLGLESAHALPRQAYWLLEQFFSQHPQEAARHRAFEQQVNPPPRALSIEQPRPVRIAAIYPGNQVSDYWRLNLEAFRHRLDQLGLDYRLESYFSRPATEVALQEQQLVEALSTDPDYLLYTLDSTRQMRSIERLLSQARPKIILLNITTPIRAWESNPPLMYVGFDHHQGTRQLADAILEQAPAPRKFVILYRDRGYVSEARGGTFLNILNARGIAPLSSYYTEADRESARVAALDALERHPDLEFIFASSTDVALGAADALKAKGRGGEVQINGWGGGEAELEALQKGELNLTVMRMNDDNGIALAEAIANDIQGKPVPQVYSGRFTIVTDQDGAQAIEKLRKDAFRASLFKD
ncbi:substrate-binding domain-containing protein [Motiliproteus sp. SC1-56]|uniref:substrate-binding domain-containing protein n=1 Tax=Motiliproteus sp. SC1-56 TaxID=2799565 RepID=UPI001A8FDA39|nr:substrate-binding domain-containing protein [Motiliproteus sp. SC1-56]